MSAEVIETKLCNDSVPVGLPLVYIKTDAWRKSRIHSFVLAWKVVEEAKKGRKVSSMEDAIVQQYILRRIK